MHGSCAKKKLKAAIQCRATDHHNLKFTHQTPNYVADMNAETERSPSPEFSPLGFDEGLTPLPEYKAAGDTAVDFSGLLNEPVRLHEDLKSGCGGQLWPAGMVLAKHMLRYHRDALQHARMLVHALISIFPWSCSRPIQNCC